MYVYSFMTNEATFFTHCSHIPITQQASLKCLLDQRGRPLRELRISITDRCNFRCVYCMPKQIFNKSFSFQPHTSLLRFEEITALARVFVSLGVTKIRLTGGEPLLRKDIEQLIAQLSAIKLPDGSDIDLSLTTNGALLLKKAKSLFDAGLKRLTVSLDAIDDDIYRQMNDVDFPIDQVLQGIEHAKDIGFQAIKVNTVIKRGVNENQILPIVQYFKNTGIIPRFIEYMDVGSTNQWEMRDVLTSSEVIARIQAKMPLEPLSPNHAGETAERWKHADGEGEIGVISSVSNAFCSDCSRIRLSTDGKLYTCLFATEGHDLRDVLRESHSVSDIEKIITQIWERREDRYSELRKEGATFPLKKIEMSYIGG